MKTHKFFMNRVEFGSRKALIIAELGTSHGCDMVKASELISAAKEAGADCIKFQMVFADEILHPATGNVILPGGSIALYERFKKLELPLSFFAELKEKVEKAGLIFLCTPFGLQSARAINSLKPECIKIASPELNYTSLLSEVARYNLPIFLSSGVSKLRDIEYALTLLSQSGNFSSSICLLHCVTSYPAPETDYNLRVMRNLSKIFGIPAGISDHSLDPELVPALAGALGAAAIEKHFCLSQSEEGLDDPIALPPDQFARMVKAVRAAEINGEENTIAAMRQERGSELVEQVLGDGIKRLAPSEAANYMRTNRSIRALKPIEKGVIIQKDMIACLRSEKNLRPGLSPEWEQSVIGRRAAQFIPSGEGIRFEDI